MLDVLFLDLGNVSASQVASWSWDVKWLIVSLFHGLMFSLHGYLMIKRKKT